MKKSGNLSKLRSSVSTRQDEDLLLPHPTSTSVSIQFLGAAGTVTGSKHLLKTPEGNILIDCGLFQGLKALRLRNWERFPIRPQDIKCVLLTHAHLDHCGYLPLLHKQGFKGKIYCSAPTAALTEIILMDSARIQEEDADYANRKGFSKHHPAVPLYNVKDVKNVLPFFELVEENEAFRLTPNLEVTYKRNGHILGSCSIQVDCYGKSIVFSGDLGRPASALLDTPANMTSADFIIMESTYGDRIHASASAPDQLAAAIQDTVQRKGNVLIPSFAVGRAQELMFIISELKRSDRIPNIPIFLDSPMGADATMIFNSHSKWHKLTQPQCVQMGSDVTIIREFEDSQEVIHMPGSKIIIAASGMLTGGRVLFYLEQYLSDERNTILFTGYQSEGTRGRALLGGVHEIKMHGSYYPVRAAIRTLGSMSGHADQGEMIKWLSVLKSPPEKIFLVHGENAAREAFRIKIQDTLKWKVETPGWLQETELFNIK